MTDTNMLGFKAAVEAAAKQHNVTSYAIVAVESRVDACRPAKPLVALHKDHQHADAALLVVGLKAVRNQLEQMLRLAEREIEKLWREAATAARECGQDRR